MAQIKSWKTGEVLFDREGNLKDTIEIATRLNIDLSFANLRWTNISGANLKGADLRFADFTGADLLEVNFEKAHLSSSTFEGATLVYANLKEANLVKASLRGAYFLGADFSNANCREAYLVGRSFADVNLEGANFEGADLFGADLEFAKNIPDNIMPIACPTSGSFIAWKKVLQRIAQTIDCRLVKLEIPEDAKRSSATTNKCRCSKAKVLAITNLHETKKYKEVMNDNYTPLTYKVGKIVYPDSFDENRWNECSHGIHFFMDKKEAILW